MQKKMAEDKTFSQKTNEENLFDLSPEPAELSKIEELRKMSPEFEGLAGEMCVRFLRARDCNVSFPATVLTNPVSSHRKS